MASMLGLLETREVAARERVEDLREAAARAAAALEAAEIELDRRVIAREEVVEALAVSAAETTGVIEAEAEPVPVPAPLPGTTVPSWQEGLPATVLAPDYQRILGMLVDRPGQEPMRAKEIAVVLGLEPTPAKVEGARVTSVVSARSRSESMPRYTCKRVAASGQRSSACLKMKGFMAVTVSTERERDLTVWEFGLQMPFFPVSISVDWKLDLLLVVGSRMRLAGAIRIRRRRRIVETTGAGLTSFEV
ncbi:hypothetical protein ACFWNG_05370 [Streptomyces sp. NPDC058391]|uniref:hypothetical protein n=1 Tax=Streptomyces sp. NPDC058391 TaxID=3346476 RepID=UPI0036632E50